MSLETLASTVIHCASETTVWLGSSQSLWAWAAGLRVSSAARAVPAKAVIFMGTPWKKPGKK